MPATLVDVSDHYVVLRPFSALGREVQRGEVFDCSAWRNVQPLINTRYLAPITAPLGRAALPADFELESIAADKGVDETPRRGPGRPRKPEVN